MDALEVQAVGLFAIAEPQIGQTQHDVDEIVVLCAALKFLDQLPTAREIARHPNDIGEHRYHCRQSIGQPEALFKVPHRVRVLACG